EKIELPEGVWSVEDAAFSGCETLTSVAFPASVEEIGDDVFDGCSPDLTLYGATGSVVEKYALENDLRFEPR
ncbi:MAG: leucine-rich repeat protein, partial [Thermoguttaceae bacterium]|nr:leucine-rich repeat protein [Thermoguttaceae bacterium]